MDVSRISAVDCLSENIDIMEDGNTQKTFSFTLLTMMRKDAIICITKTIQKGDSCNDYSIDISSGERFH